MTAQEVRQIVDTALAGCSVSDYPSVCVSKTDFGTSIYIQNGRHKMRFSDHSVTNFDRMINEEHYPIEALPTSLEDIKRIFSDDYTTLVLKNGAMPINFHMQVLKSEAHNWKTARVWYDDVVEMPIKLEELSNYNIVSIGDLTKKGDKRFCKVQVKKYAFGAYNEVTGQIECTRFSSYEGYEVEVSL